MSFGGGDGNGGSIAGADDVVLSNPADKQLLTYDFASKKWENADPAVTAADMAEKVTADTLVVQAPVATGSDQLADLQNAINKAASLHVALQLNGDHVISGQLSLPSGAIIDGTSGSIRQTLDLNPLFRFDGVSGIRLRNLTLQGKTTDWVDSSSVHAATAVYCTNTSDLRIDNCTFTGFAGDGVFAGAGCNDVHICRTKIVGPGPTYLTSTTNNFGGGVHMEPGITNWSVSFCDISGTAQGVFCGDNQTAMRVVHNYIHDIPGQHGMYIETANSGVIAGNIVQNTGLLGMKIQIGVAGDADPDSVVISNNVFFNLGDAGIILTRPQTGPGIVRRVVIAANIITNPAADGITINNADSFDLTGNLITNAGRNGISITDATDGTITGGRIDGCAWDGLRLDNVQDWMVDGLRIKNPASGDVATDEFGIKTVNACADGTLRGCTITDANGHMRYGMYVSDGDVTTLSFTDNIVSGATDYGYRGQASTARAFWGNQFSGTLGAMLTPPTVSTTTLGTIQLRDNTGTLEKSSDGGTTWTAV